MTEFGRVITQNEHNLHNGNFQFIESAAQTLHRKKQRIAFLKNRIIYIGNPLKSYDFSGFSGPSDWFRTSGLVDPNLSGKLFLLVYSDFQPFSICFTYSLTLLYPLFPSVPEPYVVIYVVKNASRPVSGELSPVLDRKRFAFQTVCIVTLSRRLCKLFLSRGRLKG